MSDYFSYRWPAKLKKFGIDDPFQMMLLAKFEKEIPWQSKVTDAQSLNTYVQKVMIPSLLSRVHYPPVQDTKNNYLSAGRIDLQYALDTDQELDSTEIEIVRLISVDDG
jgi:hypothetical protein